MLIWLQRKRCVLFKTLQTIFLYILFGLFSFLFHGLALHFVFVFMCTSILLAALHVYITRERFKDIISDCTVYQLLQNAMTMCRVP